MVAGGHAHERPWWENEGHEGQIVLPSLMDRLTRLLEDGAAEGEIVVTGDRESGGGGSDMDREEYLVREAWERALAGILLAAAGTALVGVGGVFLAGGWALLAGALVVELIAARYGWEAINQIYGD
jgi:hypothetical protein